MASKNPSVQRPTDAELNILSVIWQLGEATVRQVFNHLSETQEIGYSTVLKLMQIMVKKGILQKDDSQKPQVFSPSTSQQDTQKSLLVDLRNKAFVGSTSSLVLSALSDELASGDELREIREMIEELERRKNG